MTRSNLPGWRVAALATFCAVLTLGCSSLETKPQPEVVVKDRAHARWQAMAKGNFQLAYDFFSPAYKAINSYENFRGKLGASVTWAGAEVVSVACKPESCIATVRIEGKPLVGGRIGSTISTHVDETWLLDDGQWWFFPAQ